MREGERMLLPFSPASVTLYPSLTNGNHFSSSFSVCRCYCEQIERTLSSTAPIVSPC